MTRFKLALFAAVSMAATAGFVPSAAAIEYPWCVQYNGEEGGGRNCGFVSYEQCMMSARGAGGFCEKNLFYLDQQAKQPQRPRKHKSNN